MGYQATVLIPTHDHGRMIRHAIASAQAQTVTDIEILVVGDGAPAESAETVREIAAEDPRVRWFGFDKGPRHGEVLRAQVLRQARGEIVCYLSDDDLWMPDHVESMGAALADHAVAGALAVLVLPDDDIVVFPHDLTRPSYRRLLGRGINRVPLSCFGHTMVAYRALPHGWRTTPERTPTDLYMINQFLDAGATATSTHAPTVLHFPARRRPGMEAAARDVELLRYAELVRHPTWRHEVLSRRLIAAAMDAATTEEHRKWHARRKLRRLRRERDARIGGS